MEKRKVDSVVIGASESRHPSSTSLDFSVCESAKSLLRLVQLWSGFFESFNGNNSDESVLESAMDHTFVSPQSSYVKALTPGDGI